jgi:murein peptide amidase A
VDDGTLGDAGVRHPAPQERPGRCRTAALAAALIAGLAASAAAHAELLGRSVQGRPIVAYEVGDPAGVPVLVVGCVHGNEAAGIAVARFLLRHPPSGLDLWVVPVLNPDGRAHDTRGNAHAVDLNRNFPYRWRRLSGVYYSGPRPLSEVEARIAHALILRVRPAVSVWFHQHLDLVWASGGNLRVERRFAQVSGLPYHRLPPLAGSAIDWQNHALPGTTAFAAELPAGPASAAAVRRYARAVVAAASVTRKTP